MLKRKPKAQSPRPITDGVIRPGAKKTAGQLDLRPLKVRLRKPIRIAIVMLALMVLALILVLAFNYSRRPKRVTDDPKGLKFSIPYGFEALEDSELTKQNPNSVYGFKVATEGGVNCVISQTNRDQPGDVSPEALRDGAFGQIKINFPDASPGGYSAVKLKNDRVAASFDVSFKDNGTEYKQAEVVAVTDARATFAYCSSPSSLFDKYKGKFNDFFSSLEIY